MGDNIRVTTAKALAVSVSERGGGRSRLEGRKGAQGLIVRPLASCVSMFSVPGG